MQLKHIVIVFIMGCLIIVWLGLDDNKIKVDDTPLIGKQNIQHQIKLFEAVGNIDLPVYESSKHSDPLTALAIDLNGIIQHRTSSQGQERYAKAYLAQLRQLKRRNVAWCADVFVDAPLRQYDKYSPQTIQGMLEDYVKSETINAMKFAVSDIGKVKYPAMNDVAYQKLLEPVYQKYHHQHIDFERQQLQKCEKEIAILEKILAEPEDSRYRALAEYFSFGNNVVILF